MKILQINSVCGIRSTGRICADLAEVAEKSGHESKIAYGRGFVPEKYQKYAYRIGNRASVAFDALATRIFGNSGFNSHWATKRFIKWVREYNPDIIHLHNIHGYYINVELLFEFLKEFNRPVIWTLHDCWACTGNCPHFTIVKCDKWLSACDKCPQKGRYPSSILFDNSKKNHEKKKALFTGIENMTLVTPSNWLADIVKQSFLKQYPVRVINNGIDLNAFKPTESDFRAKYGLQNKKIVLGVASVWGNRKGLEDFVKLSETLDGDYKIVLVGVNEKQKRELPSNILAITGTDSTKELAEIYTAADVFVNPTYEDNYPTVNLEAQACGTPVITYNTGGSVESVPSENVIEQGDINSLAEKIYNFDSLKIESADFDKEYNYQKYVNLYGECNETAFFD